MFFYLYLGLAILSIVAYHICQKSIAPNIHPIVTVILSYTVALIVSLLLLPFFPLKKNILASIHDANWATYALGITTVGIEIGYLLAYRAGWKLSVASPVSMALATVLMASVGIFFFREEVHAWKIVGIIFCIVGVILLNQK